MKLSTVLLYSTIDFRWLKECLESSSKISTEVVLSSCDRLWNGQEENKNLLDKTKDIIASFPNVKPISVKWQPGYKHFFWESQCRTQAVLSVSEDSDYILFLDTDEIVNVKRFKDWVETEEYKLYDSMKLANYWYFREKKYRAKQIEDSVVLVKKDLIVKYNEILIPVLVAGREQYHELINFNKKRMILGTDGYPIIDHYSWVRTKEEMTQKVVSWGHHRDKNWIDMIEEEFSREFNGKCFVNNYTFNRLNND